jgi:hypothetical protein
VRNAVRVYAQGSADRENIDGLHSLHCEPFRIQQLLYLLPGGASLDIQDFTFFVSAVPRKSEQFGVTA